jgi:esterase/lipase superfamily enzyme
MPELEWALPEVAVPVVAVLLYAAAWHATRALPGLARVSARIAPLIVVAGVVCFSAVWSIRDVQARPAAIPEEADGAAAPLRAEALALRKGPPTTQAEAAGRDGDGASAVSASTAAKADWDVVPVFYGTDRLRNDGGKRPTYGSERARRLELGRALVTVPTAHRVPAIERPFAVRVPYFQLVLWEQKEDPKKHFTVGELRPLSHEDFLRLVGERIGASRAFADQALVFVHGFNTAFEYGLYRAAQLAYDLEFDGPVFLYSWPSGGGLLGYGHDRESATQAEPYLREFLDLIVRKSGAKHVSVIAHSMGNLPLLNVLRELGPALPEGVRLKEVILAAPDVDRDVFANIAADLRRYGRGITLYCSARDRAMKASRRFAGGVPRAGDVPADGPVIVAGIDTIDVTETSTDLLALNHSVYAEKSALLNDIALLLQTGERPPEKRIPILQKVKTAKGEFWRYP